MHLSPTRITTYRDFVGGGSLAMRMRSVARDVAIYALSHVPRASAPSRAIRFPYYHHVFDDEREDFAKHLRYLKNLGDFISIDDAVACLESRAPISGRYFCITFDDGYENCLSNAVPILVEHGAKAAFFVSTKHIGTSIERDRELLLAFNGGTAYVEYLDWDECRRMVAAGMTIGSHTVNHARLIGLPESAVEHELSASKEAIERELGVPCDHFCCPWGRPGLDFTINHEPEIARRLGYRTFLTTRRGTNRDTPKPMLVTRDHLLAGWGTHQLHYFFSR